MLYQFARLYELVFQQGTAEEVRALLRCVKRHQDPGTKILEPSCGAGRLMFPLAKMGFQVVGVDQELEMLKRAKALASKRQMSQKLRFIHGDIRWDPKTGTASYDWAYQLVGSIRHLMKEHDLQAHFETVRRLLKKEGGYYVGLNLAPESGEKPHVDDWEAARGRLKVKLRVHYQPDFNGGRRLERVHNHLVWQTTKEKNEHRSDYFLRTYTWEQWGRSLKKSGFQIQAVYDDEGRETRKRSGHFIFVLRPRSLS